MSTLAAVTLGRLEVDPSTHSTKIDGRTVSTRSHTARMLALLIENFGELVSQDTIMSTLDISTATVYHYLVDARAVAKSAGFRIRTIKGQGVTLEDDQ